MVGCEQDHTFRGCDTQHQNFRFNPCDAQRRQTGDGQDLLANQGVRVIKIRDLGRGHPRSKTFTKINFHHIRRPSCPVMLPDGQYGPCVNFHFQEIVEFFTIAHGYCSRQNTRNPWLFQKPRILAIVPSLQDLP